MFNLIVAMILVASVVFGRHREIFKATLGAHESPQEPSIMLLFLECEAPLFDPKWWCPMVSTSSGAVEKGSWFFLAFLEAQLLDMHNKAMWRYFHVEQPLDDGTMASMAEFSPMKTCCNFSRGSLGALSPLWKIIGLHSKKWFVAKFRKKSTAN